MTARILILGVGLVASLTTVYWVRKRDLREKYAIGWLGVAGIMLVLGVFPELLTTLAYYARVAVPTLLLAMCLALLVPFTFSVSISLSRAHRRNMRLTQQLAILDQRVRQLEDAGDSQG
jgi:hypothetical protein